MALSVSIVIVSYHRQPLLEATLRELLPLCSEGSEVIVVDQDPQAPLSDKLLGHPALRYQVMARPSMVGARNEGLRLAQGEVVLFLDDDVIPRAGLIEAHAAAYADAKVGGVAGRIEEKAAPGETEPHPSLFDPQIGWRFAHFDHRARGDVMTSRGCNMSFRRALLEKLGGFDTNIRMFRDDTDMCFRVLAAGYLIRFVPEAELVHLSATSGGTRGRAGSASPLRREWQMYRTHYRHYRDNLYFLLRHFRGRERRRWVFDAYRTYVGISRWPWRLLAKNLCFLAALVNAARLAADRRQHPCTLSIS